MKKFKAKAISTFVITAMVVSLSACAADDVILENYESIDVPASVISDTGSLSSSSDAYSSAVESTISSNTSSTNSSVSSSSKVTSSNGVSSTGSTSSKGGDGSRVTSSKGTSSKNTGNSSKSDNPNSIISTSSTVDNGNSSNNGGGSSNTSHSVPESSKPSNTENHTENQSKVVSSQISSVVKPEPVSSQEETSYSEGDTVPYDVWEGFSYGKRLRYTIDKNTLPEDLRAYAYPFDVNRVIQDIRDEAERRGMLYDPGLICIDRHFDENGNDLGNAGWTFPYSLVNVLDTPEDTNGIEEYANCTPEDIKNGIVYGYLDYVQYACEEQWSGADMYDVYDSLNLTPVIFFNIECEESLSNVFDIYIPYEIYSPTKEASYFGGYGTQYSFGRTVDGTFVTFQGEFYKENFDDEDFKFRTYNVVYH